MIFVFLLLTFNCGNFGSHPICKTSIFIFQLITFDRPMTQLSSIPRSEENTDHLFTMTADGLSAGGIYYYSYVDKYYEGSESNFYRDLLL